jgi:hypothetical protein
MSGNITFVEGRILRILVVGTEGVMVKVFCSRTGI